MNNTVIGSKFELSLRIMILLDEYTPSDLDEQQIGAIDFISIYAADFGLMDLNLHGNNSYRYSEYPARKHVISSALKDLILDGYVLLRPTNNGYVYSITNKGKDACVKLSSSYSEEYRLSLRAVKSKYDNGNFELMSKDIKRLTALSLKGGQV